MVFQKLVSKLLNPESFEGNFFVCFHFLLWDISKLFSTNCQVLITQLQQLWIHGLSHFISTLPYFPHPIPWVILK